MGFRNKCSCKRSSHFNNKSCNRYQSCLCDQFSHLTPGSAVRPAIGGSNFLNNNVKFACFNQKNRCTTFIVDGFLVIADCRKIHGIQFR